MKITRNEWNDINPYNYAAKWVRPYCEYSLIKRENGTFRREQRMKIIPYLLLFIPAHVIEFFVCAWDGGIKEYCFFERYLGGDTIYSYNDNYSTCEELFKRKTC